MMRLLLPVLLFLSAWCHAADLLGAYAADVEKDYENVQQGEGGLRFQKDGVNVTVLTIKDQCVMFFLSDAQGGEAGAAAVRDVLKELQPEIVLDKSGVYKGKDVYARMWSEGSGDAAVSRACVVSSIVVRNMKSRNKDKSRLGLSVAEFVCELGVPNRFDGKSLEWDVDDMAVSLPLNQSVVKLISWKWRAKKLPEQEERLEAMELTAAKKWLRMPVYPADEPADLEDGSILVAGTGAPYDVNRAEKAVAFGNLSGAPNTMSTIKTRWGVKIAASPWVLARNGEGEEAVYILGARSAVEAAAVQAAQATDEEPVPDEPEPKDADTAADEPGPEFDDPADLRGEDAVEAYKKRIMGL